MDPEDDDMLWKTGESLPLVPTTVLGLGDSL